MRLRSAIYRLVGSGLPLCSAIGLGPDRDTVGIIMAHGVYLAENIAGVPMPPSGVPFEVLETNLLGLRGYSIISLAEAVAMLKRDLPFKKRCLVLTFDDSLKTYSDLVAPALLKWGIPATFYLSTDILVHQRPYWWLRLDYALAKMNGTPISIELPNGESLTITQQQKSVLRRRVMTALRSHLRPNQCERAVESIELQLGIGSDEATRVNPYGHAMSWKDARDLALKGFTIGSHTCSHPNLTLLRPDELQFELENSKKLIEEGCGVVCRDLCYPYGLHSAESYAAANSAGYASAVTTESGEWNKRGGNSFLLRRFGLPRQPYQLPFLLTGLR